MAGRRHPHRPGIARMPDLRIPGERPLPSPRPLQERRRTMWLPTMPGRRSARISRAALRRRSTSVRFAVEPLEGRLCPSCLVFQRGDTLFVRGDDLDNTIALANDRDTIQVTCDGRAAEFSGVSNYDVKS